MVPCLEYRKYPKDPTTKTSREMLNHQEMIESLTDFTHNRLFSIWDTLSLTK